MRRSSRRTPRPACSSRPLLAVSARRPPRSRGQDARGRVATIVGTAGDDVLVGDHRRDVIVGLGGDDRSAALGGDDLCAAARAPTRSDGGAGDDLLLGGLGAGVLSGGAGDDRLIGSMMITAPDPDLSADEQAVAGGPGRDSYFMRFVMQGVATSADATGKVDLRHARSRSPTRVPGRHACR